MKKIINLLTTILTLMLLIYSITINSNIEYFSNGDVFIKKTQTYDLVFYDKENNYSIWSPRPIGDYYPLGHIFSKGQNMPKTLSTLIKSDNTNQPRDRPIRYEPVSIVTNKNNKQLGFFWKPITYKGYKSLGHIFHSKLPPNKVPSLHKHIRCVPNKFIISAGIGDLLMNDKKKGTQIWSIIDNSYFISNQTNNFPEPKDKVFKLNDKNLKTENKIRTKKN